MCLKFVFIFSYFALIFLNLRFKLYISLNQIYGYILVSLILQLFHIFFTSFKLSCFSSDTSYFLIKALHESCTFSSHYLIIPKVISIFLSLIPVTVTRQHAHYWVVFPIPEQRLPSHQTLAYVVCYLSCLHAHLYALAPIHSAQLEPLALISASRPSSPSVSVPDSEPEKIPSPFPLPRYFYQDYDK